MVTDAWPHGRAGKFSLTRDSSPGRGYTRDNKSTRSVEIEDFSPNNGALPLALVGGPGVIDPASSMVGSGLAPRDCFAASVCVATTDHSIRQVAL